MKRISECLEEGMREWFEERAGIMEYDGGLSRAEAERRARVETEEWKNRNRGDEK